jgi:hypothetical protein
MIIPTTCEKPSNITLTERENRLAAENHLFHSIGSPHSIMLQSCVRASDSCKNAQQKQSFDLRRDDGELNWRRYLQTV